MRNKAMIALVASQLLLMTGCYSKYLVLQAEVVSMTRQEAGTTKTLPSGADISEKWCVGDKLAFEQGDSKNVGLADQVIYKAQDGGRKADFITNVQIYRDTKNCALLTGKASKL